MQKPRCTSDDSMDATVGFQVRQVWVKARPEPTAGNEAVGASIAASGPSGRPCLRNIMHGTRGGVCQPGFELRA